MTIPAAPIPTKRSRANEGAIGWNWSGYWASALASRSAAVCMKIV